MPTDILKGMYTVFLENRALSYIFLTLLLLSIICQTIIGVIYLKLIKQTDNMACAKSKFLKQCKLKFINCYQVSGEVTNVSVFVDKSMTKISFLGISMSGLHHLAGQFVLLSVVAAGAGACQEITQGETVGKILPYYIVSFLGLYVYFSVSGLVDITGKKERLKINLVDYLENHMANKLKQSDVDWEKLTGENLSVEKRKTHLWNADSHGKKKGVHKKKAAADIKEAKAAKKKGNQKAGIAGNVLELDKGGAKTNALRMNGEKAEKQGKKDKKDRKAAAAGLDAKEKKRLLREGIGLSAEREIREPAKVMAFTPAGEQDNWKGAKGEEAESGYTGKENAEQENIRREDAEGENIGKENKGEAGMEERKSEEEKVAVFSHQEAQELEELLREILV